MKFYFPRRAALPALCAALLIALAAAAFFRGTASAQAEAPPPTEETEPDRAALSAGEALPAEVNPAPEGGAAPGEAAPSPAGEALPAGEEDAPEEEALPAGADPASWEGRPMVALTYDDGPHPVCTDQILDILEEYGARATFFEVGSRLDGAPEALLREEALGCEVASHSYGHKKFSKLSGEEVLEDMRASGAAFAETLGHPVTMLRPPYGAWNEALEGEDYICVKWSVDPADWQCLDAEEVVSFLQSRELDGQVVLLHGTLPSTVEATRTLVPWLQEQGYELVTVSELIRRRFGEEPQPGKYYDAHYFWSALPAVPPAGTYSNYKAS